MQKKTDLWQILNHEKITAKHQFYPFNQFYMKYSWYLNDKKFIIYCQLYQGIIEKMQKCGGKQNRIDGECFDIELRPILALLQEPLIVLAFQVVFVY